MIRHVIASLLAALFLVGGVSVFAQVNPLPMTNSDVVKMTGADMKEAAIIKEIMAATPNFEITDKAVAALIEQKVPNNVILAMIRRQNGWNFAHHKVQAKPHTKSDIGPKWEIEIHGGIPGNFTQSNIVVNTPTAETYSLAGSGATGYWSKRVSSWYFGDGAALIGLSSSLDPILAKPMVQTHGQIFGFRASRGLKNWLAAEVSFDRSGGFAFTDAGLAQIESARAAFETKWSRLNVPGNTPSASVSTVSRYGGSQIFATGAIVVSFPLTSKVKPYVTAGAGLVSGSGNNPGFTLLGSYGGPDAPETDSVHVTLVKARDRAFTEIFGGGVKIYLTKHMGIRLDARAYLYHNPFTPLLDASHTNTPNAAWVINPTDAFNNSVASLQKLSGPGLGAYSTLSGPSISGLRTVIGSGGQRQTPITVGLFWRF
jgi:hypothetical protein